jgi:hypothetical protein
VLFISFHGFPSNTSVTALAISGNPFSEVVLDLLYAKADRRLAEGELSGDPLLALSRTVHQPYKEIIVGERHQRFFIPHEEGFGWQVAVWIEHSLTPFGW